LPLRLLNLEAMKLLQIGLQHNSNGQGGTQSRSLNYLYARVSTQFNNLFLHFENWYRIPEKQKDHITDHKGDDNPDYIDYYGDGSIEASYLWKKNIFSLLYRYNFTDIDKGAFTASWSFPLKDILGNDKVYGYLKYFDGYGESLIDYNRRVQRIGLGVQFSR
ncbi:MAG: phospholipase A, partial [Campylobacterota bacterium]